jgi:hypothetical protein
MIDLLYRYSEGVTDTIIACELDRFEDKPSVYSHVVARMISTDFGFRVWFENESEMFLHPCFNQFALIGKTVEITSAALIKDQRFLPCQTMVILLDAQEDADFLESNFLSQIEDFEYSLQNHRIIVKIIDLVHISDNLIRVSVSDSLQDSASLILDSNFAELFAVENVIGVWNPAIIKAGADLFQMQIQNSTAIFKINSIVANPIVDCKVNVIFGKVESISANTPTIEDPLTPNFVMSISNNCQSKEVEWKGHLPRIKVGHHVLLDQSIGKMYNVTLCPGILNSKCMRTLIPLNQVNEYDFFYANGHVSNITSGATLVLHSPCESEVQLLDSFYYCDWCSQCCENVKQVTKISFDFSDATSMIRVESIGISVDSGLYSLGITRSNASYYLEISSKL